MKSLTGAIVDRFDTTLTTLQGLVTAMWSGTLPENVILPYVSVTEIDTTRLEQAKGSPGFRIDRCEILFEVFGTEKNEVHTILRQIEGDYLNTILSIRNRTQLGRPMKINRTSFKEGDLWVGQFSLAYLLEKAGS